MIEALFLIKTKYILGFVWISLAMTNVINRRHKDPKRPFLSRELSWLACIKKKPLNSAGYGHYRT